MIQSGYAITRKSFQTLASRALQHTNPPITTTPFICASCRARGYATGRWKGRNAQNNPPMIESLKRLERHVQQLEMAYKDITKKRRVEAEVPGIDISEEMQDKAYKALMAESQPINFLEAPPRKDVRSLPTQVLQRLGETGQALIQYKSRDWDQTLEKLIQTGGFSGLGLSTINYTISCIPKVIAAKYTDVILSMIQKAEMEGDTLTYDLLMLANAEAKDTSRVRELFMTMKDNGNVPTEYSFGHLLRAFSLDKDIYAASAAFREMMELNITPNLVLYTTLIQICLNGGEISAAWEVFDLMKYRSTATKPDVKTYSLMIHACALEGEIEKALNLFHDMTVNHGLEASEHTYHALIHCCAVRKDYLHEAWRYAQEMQAKGMKMKTETLNVLLLGCGKSGELTRARMLVRHMAAGTEDVQPDERTFHALLRAYANYKPPITLKAPASKRLKQRVQVSSQIPESFINPIRHINRKPDAAALSTLMSDNLPELPFTTKNVLTTHAETVAEAENIYNFLKRYTPDIVSTNLTNAFVSVLLNQGYYDQFEEFYHTNLSSESEPHPHLITKNVHTFQIAIQAAFESRNVSFARQIAMERAAFTKSGSYAKFSNSEKLKFDFHFDRFYVNTLARGEYMREARGSLQKLRNKYTTMWTLETLLPFLNKSIQLEDWVSYEAIHNCAINGRRKEDMHDNVTEYPAVAGWQQRARAKVPAPKIRPVGRTEKDKHMLEGSPMVKKTMNVTQIPDREGRLDSDDDSTEQLRHIIVAKTASLAPSTLSSSISTISQSLPSASTLDPAAATSPTTHSSPSESTSAILNTPGFVYQDVQAFTAENEPRHATMSS